MKELAAIALAVFTVSRELSDRANIVYAPATGLKASTR